MTRDDIIRMAREAEIPIGITGGNATLQQIQLFAELVAAAEREACALEVERARLHMDGILSLTASTYFIASRVTDYLAARIRAQGHGEAA